MDHDEDSISRPLGCGEIGPVEPPPAKLRVETDRRPWAALAAFGIVGATAILVFSGPVPLAGEIGRVWQSSREEPEPPTDAPVIGEDVYAVRVDGLPAIGRADAKVTLVVVTDYACGACREARDTVLALRGSYGDDLRIVWKPRAITEASVPILAGACAAALQGQLAAYDDAAWRVTVDRSRRLGLPIATPDPAQVSRMARELALDTTRFASALRRCEAVVKASTSELIGLDVEGPAYFVNGRLLDPWGIESLGTFQSLIDEELAKARKRIAGGTAAGRYYREWVLDAGKTAR